MTSNPRFLNIAGQRLEYAWHGPSPSQATTLVFLHEGLGCTSMWRDFPAELAEATSCGALVYSRFGYGKSDPCALPRSIHYMHEEALTILPQVLAATDIRDCILIGHSDGGSIALIYAGGTEAKAVRGIITEAAHVFCEPISVESIAAVRTSYLAGDLRQKLSKHHGDNVDYAFWGWNDVWLHPDFRAWNIEEYLPKIRQPVLALQGAEDQYGTLAQVEAIEKGIERLSQSLILAACQHTPHREQKSASLAAMTAFIHTLFTPG